MLIFTLPLAEEMLAKVDSLRKSNKEVERNRRVVSGVCVKIQLKTGGVCAVPTHSVKLGVD